VAVKACDGFSELPDFDEVLEMLKRQPKDAVTFEFAAAMIVSAWASGYVAAEQKLPELIRQALREEREVRRYG
jgi:hypothetical protein